MFGRKLYTGRGPSPARGSLSSVAIVPVYPVEEERVAEQIDNCAAAIKRARELCGCTQCQGGYEIGGRTIAMQRGEQRPYSCVAAVVLESMLIELRHEASRG